MMRFQKLWSRLLLVAVLGLTSQALGLTGQAQAATQVQSYPYDVGLKKARAESKWIMVKFEREDCIYCEQMSREIQSSDTLRQILGQDFIWIQVDQKGKRKVQYQGKSITETQLTQQLKAWNYPYLLFLKPDGTPIGSLIGYQSPQTMQQLLQYIRSEAYLTMPFARYKNKK